MADRRSGCKNSLREHGIHEAVEIAISPKRLSTYKKAVDGDQQKALQLHAWNTAVSATLYGPLQGLEITLRNAMHRQLAVKYGEEWYDNQDAEFDRYACNQVANTKQRLQKHSLPVEASQIVANLSFGYWVSLTGPGSRRDGGGKSNYEMTLWRPALREVFPYSTKSILRKDAYALLDNLRNLRNRIAHHEPIIFRPDLLKDHEDILQLASWICPEMAEWIERHSQVHELLGPDGSAILGLLRIRGRRRGLQSRCLPVPICPKYQAEIARKSAETA